jgi:hypothetical protein
MGQTLASSLSLTQDRYIWGQNTTTRFQVWVTIIKILLPEFLSPL